MKFEDIFKLKNGMTVKHRGLTKKIDRVNIGVITVVFDNEVGTYHYKNIHNDIEIVKGEKNGSSKGESNGS